MGVKRTRAGPSAPGSLAWTAIQMSFVRMGSLQAVNCCPEFTSCGSGHPLLWRAGRAMDIDALHPLAQQPAAVVLSTRAPPARPGESL
jgi:hypothetical protein